MRSFLREQEGSHVKLSGSMIMYDLMHKVFILFQDVQSLFQANRRGPRTGFLKAALFPCLVTSFSYGFFLLSYWLSFLNSLVHSMHPDSYIYVYINTFCELYARILSQGSFCPLEVRRLPLAMRCGHANCYSRLMLDLFDSFR